MATFIYYVLYKKLVGKAKAQVTVAELFDRGTTPFKHLITGVKQKGGPGRQAKTSKKSLDDVCKAEGEPPTKKKPGHNQKEAH